ncbi:origin recognition complex subunit [Apiospora phragmitis]|uniref:Origin recognition complex subunit n=1 Tax=Apiospora phragmitis TaxID=2905665 RepID=A0ABR1TSJ5_9PEZI
MADTETLGQVLGDQEHQAAYIFDPAPEAPVSARPAKRGRISKKHAAQSEKPKEKHTHHFQPLLNGLESNECLQLRQDAFLKSWSRVQDRIDGVLRETNQSTLEAVTAFIKECTVEMTDSRIPSALIITGANMASQSLLFEQLSGSLQARAGAKVVLLRSGDASNLKAALRKIILEVVANPSDAGEEQTSLSITMYVHGKRYLNYDLEALRSHLALRPSPHVIVAFQDSEAFETGLLTDLILLFSSWLDRIPFKLLFGVATSVELFQARLLKSTCQLLYGRQFDVEQADTIVEKIFKTAVAHVDAPLRIGPVSLQMVLSRQRDQAAGIPVFVSSLKYAYMCHFYTNPFSILLADNAPQVALQAEHLEVARSLSSFRNHVEASLHGKAVSHVQSLLDDDDYLNRQVQMQLLSSRSWVCRSLRTLQILMCHQGHASKFTQLYVDLLSQGVDGLDQLPDFVNSMRRMDPAEMMSLLNQIVAIIQDGDSNMGLQGCKGESVPSVTLLSGIVTEIQTLCREAEDAGSTLRSEYSGQNKIMRTTVIAQKVQLSHDAATLTPQDKSYTRLVEEAIAHVEALLKCERAEDVWLHEAWLYDFKTPYREVFMPRPRSVVQRALLRPHDYLACSCCNSSKDQIMPTLPATAILYHLYLETGSLINVADLWTAFFGIVSEDEADGLDERTALVMFYRALSEMRVLGFVKPSRKKVDHIAKLAWL